MAKGGTTHPIDDDINRCLIPPDLVEERRGARETLSVVLPTSPNTYKLMYVTINENVTSGTVMQSLMPHVPGSVWQAYNFPESLDPIHRYLGLCALAKDALVEAGSESTVGSGASAVSASGTSPLRTSCTWLNPLVPVLEDTNYNPKQTILVLSPRPLILRLLLPLEGLETKRTAIVTLGRNVRAQSLLSYTTSRFLHIGPSSPAKPILDNLSAGGSGGGTSGSAGGACEDRGTSATGGGADSGTGPVEKRAQFGLFRPLPASAAEADLPWPTLPGIQPFSQSTSGIGAATVPQSTTETSRRLLPDTGSPGNLKLAPTKGRRFLRFGRSSSSQPATSAAQDPQHCSDLLPTGKLGSTDTTGRRTAPGPSEVERKAIYSLQRIFPLQIISEAGVTGDEVLTLKLLPRPEGADLAGNLALRRLHAQTLLSGENHVKTVANELALLTEYIEQLPSDSDPAERTLITQMAAQVGVAPRSAQDAGLQ